MGADSETDARSIGAKSFTFAFAFTAGSCFWICTCVPISVFASYGSLDYSNSYKEAIKPSTIECDYETEEKVDYLEHGSHRE
jgi:hypothetical protein